MKRLLTSLLALTCSTGCMLSPTDDGRVASTTAPLTFNGYHTYSNAPVQVRAWNFATNAMENLGAPVMSAATSTVALEKPLYAWASTRTLGPNFWRAGPISGRCAVTAARTTLAGSGYNLVTVEEDWASCFGANNNTTSSFAQNCAADDSPHARLYTNDWGSRVVDSSRLALVALVAGGQITVNLDNFTPTAWQFCNAGNPDGCPAGGASDPETWKFFNPNASFISQRAADGTTSTMNFNIDPTRSQPMTVYIDDMRSRSLGLRVEGDELVLRINFEATGAEIRMNCIRDGLCPFIDGRTIDFAAPSVDLRFRLEVKGAKVTYTTARAVFTGGTAGDEARDAETGISEAITEKLSTDATIRASVSEALDGMVRGAADIGTFPVAQVTVGGGVMNVRPGCPLD